MPTAIPRACRKRGCSGTTTDRSGYCEAHRNEGWQQYQRGLTRHQRGYPDNFYQDNWYECGFREFTGAPQPGDVVIMQVQSNKWNHAGVLLEGNMLLHHLYGHLSQRVPYGGYWKERTMKILRYKDKLQTT